MLWIQPWVRDCKRGKICSVVLMQGIAVKEILQLFNCLPLLTDL